MKAMKATASEENSGIVGVGEATPNVTETGDLVRVNVTVDGADSEWTIAFSRADHELLDVMKKAVPGSSRRWERADSHWRITADVQVMVDLCTALEQLGASVAKPDILSQRRPDDDGHSSAEYWERKYRSMEEAARWQHGRIQELEDERDGLEERLRVATMQSTVVEGWAEMLLATVGPALRESVFKALTKCLHPDVSGEDRTWLKQHRTMLQQQLNAARDKARRE
ncbi:hypothetical protein ACIP5Y_15530 [Nocardia sp. NPDC088792]|uniref:hypothetical protein n=1 Tax=Nocardia sp. NPDC088792 TaxID=3364332 RepID=UPI00380BAA45